MMQLIRFLNESKLLVAFAAAALCAETFFLCDSKISSIIIAQAFFLTWSAYLFLKSYVGVGKRVMIYTAATGSVLSILYNPSVPWWLIAGVGLLVLMYSSHNAQRYGLKLGVSLRGVPIVKTLAIATCWTVIATFSVAFFDTDIDEGTIYLIAASNFLFIAALSLAEDIRDTYRDHHRIETIVALFGVGWAKSFAIFLLVLSSVICCFTPTFETPEIALAYLSVMAIAIIIILLLSPKRSRQIQALAIDGIIILRFLAIAYVSIVVLEKTLK